MADTIEAREQEIIEEFSFFPDWMEKYEHLIEIGKSLPIISDEHKNQDHIIKGCQSQVWLNAELQGDKIAFSADSDAIITKGIIGLMIRVLNHQKPKDIAQAELKFIDEIGLKEHLSPTRSNGLVSMIKQMKLYAVALQAKLQNS